MAKRQDAHVIREELVVLTWHVSATAHDECTLIRSCSANASRLRHEINLAQAFSRARRMNRVTVREARTMKWCLFAMTFSDMSGNKIYKWSKNTNRGIAAHCRILTTNIHIWTSSTVDPEFGNTLWDICVDIYMHVYTRCPGMIRFKSDCECSNRLTADHTTDVQSSRASRISHISQNKLLN